MKKEKIVLSFLAVLFGLLVAGGAFYLYQSTKVIPPSETKTISITPPSQVTKAPQNSSIFLAVDTPKDEEVIDRKTITISGKTIPEASIAIITASTDQVVTPARNGNFSTTAVLENGVNYIEILAIAPNGEEAKVTRTVTFSTEDF